MKAFALYSYVSAAVMAMLLAACGEAEAPDYNAKERRIADSLENRMVAAPGKKPLRLLTDRPYNLETPLHYFMQDITPNDVFFVRWHLPLPPQQVSEDTFRLRVTGNAARPLALSIQDLKTKFEPYKLVAVCACAGNARNFCDPRVPGAQWKNGGMGNAEWTGVRLKDILQMAGTRANTKSVSFNGLDQPVFPNTPDFIKSLELAHAMDGEVMVAYAMNGEPLPYLNGYPLKLVVPGWYATYWVGMLSHISLHAGAVDNYWMDKAYRIPIGAVDGNENPAKLSRNLVPISRMDVRSLFVHPEPGTVIEKGVACELQGLAMDDGTGITKVELSSDGGTTWQPARLGPDLGRYSWRRWHYTYTPPKEGDVQLLVKATNAAGKTQPVRHWNRSGYMRNEIESLPLVVR